MRSQRGTALLLFASAASYRAATFVRVKPLLLAEVAAIAVRQVALTLVRRAARGPLRPGWPVRTELAQSVMRALLMRSKRRGLPWLRAAQASLMTGVPFERQVEAEPVVLGGVPCVWHTPSGRRPERAIVYFHGGGFVMGSVAGDRELLTGWAEATLGSGDANDPRFTVANADLSGLPPLLVQVGSVELLYDQVLRFTEGARKSGVEVTLEVLPEVFHDVHLQAALLPEGAAAIEAVADYLRSRI